MIKELHQNPQAFVTSEFLIEIAVRLFSFSEAAKFLCRLFHGQNINLAAVLSERT
jgi:hypothetical protein